MWKIEDDKQAAKCTKSLFLMLCDFGLSLSQILTSFTVDFHLRFFCVTSQILSSCWTLDSP